MGCKNNSFWILLLVIVLVLSSCGPQSKEEASGSTSGTMQERKKKPDDEKGKNQEEEEGRSAEDTASKILSPSWVWKNNLEIEEIKEASREDGLWKGEVFYVQISGLKNKKIEKKINNQIRTTVEKLKEPTPGGYRGIEAYLKDATAVDEVYITTEIYENTSNVLSVKIYRGITWLTMDDESRKNVQEEVCLNFDLTTGKQLKLEELFQDPDRGMEAINRYVAEYLRDLPGDENWIGEEPLEDEAGEIYGIRMVQGFRGISPDQKFLLGYGGIQLVMDYEEPQFITDFRPEEIPIPTSYVGDNLAWPHAFLKEKSIFEEEEQQKQLFVSSSYGMRKFGYKEYQSGAFSVVEKISLPRNLPASIEEMAQNLVKTTPALLKESNKRIRDLKKRYPLESWEYSYFQREGWVSDIGAYYVIQLTESKGIPLPDGEGLTPEDSYERFAFHCYGKTDLQEVTLQDIFVPEYDYTSALEEAIVEKLWDMDWILTEKGKEKGKDPEYAAEYAAKIVKEINGVNLEEDAFQVSVNEEKIPDLMGNFGYMLRFEYSLFGDENIALFQK